MPAEKRSDSESVKSGPAAKDPGTLVEQCSPKWIQSVECLERQLKDTAAFRARHNRPFIAVSYAQSIDGSIASRNKEPIALSGPKSSLLTHQIRACCDSILIGIGTVLADNPRLSVRKIRDQNQWDLSAIFIELTGNI